MKKRRKQSGRLLAQLHGSFTPAHADGCAAQCFEGVQRGSIIILSARHRPQAAMLAFRFCVNRSLPSEGHGALAVRLDTNRSYPSALYCHTWPGFLFQDSTGRMLSLRSKERERNLPRQKVKPALLGSLLQCRRSVWSQAEAAYLHRRTGTHSRFRL